MISRKDYDMIAKVFNRRLTGTDSNLVDSHPQSNLNAYTQGRIDGIATVALDLGYELQAVNPRFKIEQWVTATTKRGTN